MADNAYFAGNPTRLDISRSKMTARPRWTGQWNVGRLVPIFATQVLPGSTYSMSVNSAIRMITPVVPVMDDMDITIEAFYVPNRLLLSRKTMSPDLNDSNHSWAAFIGAQDSLLNMPVPGDVRLPFFDCTLDAFEDNPAIGSLGDCLGFPFAGTADNFYRVNCLKPLAYYAIWNDYFREPNTQSPATFSIDSYGHAFISGADLGLPDTDVGDVLSMPLAGVSRYHGYFGSALPWPQRNSTQVELPLGDLAPVTTAATGPSVDADITSVPLKWKFAGGDTEVFATGSLGVTSQAGSGALTGQSSGGFTASGGGIFPSNLFADLSSATAASVNQFRLAVQTQRWYEALARSGNKYHDLVAGMFNVYGDAPLDRPEYLGGFTAPINLSQVASTAETGTGVNSGLGKVGAFSLSNPGGFLFSKSFTEHGILMVVACCRVKESFSQGIAREDTRFDRFDFYWPQFANLGEQPILQKEIFVTGSSDGSTTDDDTVFGYQEAWAEERMVPDIVTGQFRAGGNMEQWTYVNNFEEAPTLKDYLDARNQVAQVDKTIAVSSETAGFQLFGQFEFDITMVKPMPLYSIPGLVDHH